MSNEWICEALGSSSLFSLSDKTTSCASKNLPLYSSLTTPTKISRHLPQTGASEILLAKLSTESMFSQTDYNYKTM